MKATNHNAANQRLSRLYDLKKQQLGHYQENPSSLVYLVLAAEAEAINAAMDRNKK